MSAHGNGLSGLLDCSPCGFYCLKKAPTAQGFLISKDGSRRLPVSERSCQVVDASMGPSGRTVSVVTPVFNEQECVEPFYQRLRATLEACRLIGYEVIFINDGSTDRTPSILAELAANDPAVKVLTLSRNFGHHPAVFAGLSFSTGDMVVMIDADLQDPPELIPSLLEKLDSGCQLVLARRQGTTESVVLKVLKRGFRTL